MKQKIAIIGANSFIARNLLYELNTSSEDYFINLYGKNEGHMDHIDNYVSVDVTSRESVKLIDLKCDIIYVFSGKTGSSVGFNEYSDFIDVNEIGLLNILSEYRDQGSNARIIFPSTRLVYRGSNTPILETDEKEFKTIYAINKFACEQYLKMYSNAFGIKYTVFRISVPYGTVIPNASSYGTIDFMMKQAKNGSVIKLFGDGRQRRTFTHMSYLCKTLIEGAKSSLCENDVFNIGGEDYSLNEVATIIGNKMCIPVQHVAWPVVDSAIESGSTVFNSSKLDALLNIDYEIEFRKWLDTNAEFENEGIIL